MQQELKDYCNIILVFKKKKVIQSFFFFSPSYLFFGSWWLIQGIKLFLVVLDLTTEHIKGMTSCVWRAEDLVITIGFANFL